MSGRRVAAALLRRLPGLVALTAGYAFGWSYPIVDWDLSREGTQAQRRHLLVASRVCYALAPYLSGRQARPDLDRLVAELERSLRERPTAAAVHPEVRLLDGLYRSVFERPVVASRPPAGATPAALGAALAPLAAPVRAVLGAERVAYAALWRRLQGGPGEVRLVYPKRSDFVVLRVQDFDLGRVWVYGDGSLAGARAPTPEVLGPGGLDGLLEELRRAGVLATTAAELKPDRRGLVYLEALGYRQPRGPLPEVEIHLAAIEGPAGSRVAPYWKTLPVERTRWHYLADPRARRAGEALETLRARFAAAAP